MSFHEDSNEYEEKVLWSSRCLGPILKTEQAIQFKESEKRDINILHYLTIIQNYRLMLDTCRLDNLYTYQNRGSDIDEEFSETLETRMKINIKEETSKWFNNKEIKCMDELYNIELYTEYPSVDSLTNKINVSGIYQHCDFPSIANKSRDLYKKYKKTIKWSTSSLMHEHDLYWKKYDASRYRSGDLYMHKV